MHNNIIILYKEAHLELPTTNQRALYATNQRALCTAKGKTPALECTQAKTTTFSGSEQSSPISIQRVTELARIVDLA